MQALYTFRTQIVRHRSRRARMWNMGLLFLIYYCVSIYSAKGDEKAEIPPDVGMLPEAPDADIPTESEGPTSIPYVTSEVSAQGNPSWQYTVYLSDSLSTGQRCSARYNTGHAHSWRCAHLATQTLQLHAASHRAISGAADEQMGATARRPHPAHPGGDIHLLRPGHCVRRVLCGQSGQAVRG